MYFDLCVEHSPELGRDVSALFVDAEQVSAYVEIRSVYRNVLRRQALLDNSPHFIFGDRRQRGVVAVEKRQTDVFVFYKERRSCVCGVAVTETEDAFVCTLARNDLLEVNPEIFPLGAVELNFPILATLLPHFEHQLGFTRGVKTEVEIVANNTPVDLYYSVAGFQIHLGPKALGNHFRDLDAPAANACNCWSNCK